MIIVRSPLRITLGGGGTDLPSYYRQFGGELIAGAIRKYIFVALKDITEKEFRLRIDRISEEQSASVDGLKHALSREALRFRKSAPGLEVHSFADLPPRSGLGSSGAFTVALLRALTLHGRSDELKGEKRTALSELQRAELAEEASRLEIEVLGLPVGKQDQYVTTFGGLRRYRFEKNGEVEVTPLALSEGTKQALQNHLVLFYTGVQREVHRALQEQKEKTEALDAEMIRNLDFTKELGQATAKSLESGNITEFASLLDLQWQKKRERSRDVSNEKIDQVYDVAKEYGALGGKLIGGGGAGFLMFYTENPLALSQAMASLGLSRCELAFDEEGTSTIHC